MTTIVLTGPESTGKTTVGQFLADELDLPLVPEMARSYLQGMSSYEPADLLRIAALQCEAEEGGGICDTDLQVIAIWWAVRFGPVPASLQNRRASLSPRFYLLCCPDLLWQPDPLRENPYDRDRLFTLYRDDLERRGLSYELVSGEGPLRLERALDHCRKWLRAD